MAGTENGPIALTADIASLSEDTAKTIAMALKFTPPGEYITVHAKKCGYGDRCACHPISLRAGAQA